MTTIETLLKISRDYLNKNKNKNAFFTQQLCKNISKEIKDNVFQYEGTDVYILNNKYRLFVYTSIIDKLQNGVFTFKKFPMIHIERDIEKYTICRLDKFIELFIKDERHINFLLERTLFELY